MANNNLINIFCDFDGTITKNDISVAVLKNFAQWEKQTTRTILKGNIGSKHAYSAVAPYIKASLDQMIDFAKQIAQIEDGFINFFNFVKSKNFNFSILSDGFEFYINAILNKNNIETKFFASRLVEDENGLRFEFPNESKFCDLCATCKLKIIRQEGNGYFKIFIGNGISDRCVVEEADIVFAKSRLQDICYIKGVSFFPFNNFNDILYAFRIKPKCFVIDFDGTIGWSYEGILDAFTYTFRKLKKNMPAKSELVKLIGLPLEECFKNTVGEDYKNAVELFRQRYKKIFLKKTYIAPGTKETFEELKKLGYKIAILSNKNSFFLKKLIEHFELDVDLVVGEGDILENGKVIRKPDTRTIDFISEKLNVNKKEIVVVGDTEVDLLTARDCNFVALCSLYHPPDYFKEKGRTLAFITSISDLLKFGRFYKILSQ
ncbi:MAG: HAD family hydrolase [Candidatus Calescibacterium sp.]|nr:HAD family hydrolase [Candidatus Calescibacterium sp.]MCX7734793.1 HAD family hydrolase [bacterium]MDW8087384.1 HAD family hydrolase [Candidatus Calescibacterium sp.]